MKLSDVPVQLKRVHANFMITSLRMDLFLVLKATAGVLIRVMLNFALVKLSARLILPFYLETVILFIPLKSFRLSFKFLCFDRFCSAC